LSDFHIARASCRDDIKCVAPLFDAYRVFYGQVSNLAGSCDFLLQRWVANESVLFVARDDSVASLGFVHLYPSFLSDRMQRFWILNDLYVVPELRQRGVARALLRRAQQHALDTGSGGLSLSTAVTNVNAQALYESEGYVLDRDFLYYNKFLANEP
jgi:ribosomal protein S18 acetylase RimI-like enzyme